jgi:hypothetical protein
MVKYKDLTVPITVEEEKKVKSLLSPKDVRLLSISTRTIDFGRVCVYSKTSRSLNIGNYLQQYVLMTITHQLKELQHSLHLTQVVSPGGMVRFDVVFSSDYGQSFSGQVLAHVNG